MQINSSLKISLLLMISFISISAVGETNAMDGSFRYDIDLFSKGPRLRIFYNSRSLHEGVFGLGWCASFEKKWVYRQNSYWLLDCNLPIPLKINPQKAKKIGLLKNQLKNFQMQKTEHGFWISNGQEKVEINLKNSLLASIKTPSFKFSFEYDKNSNLSILKNLSTQNFELIHYDDQDRVQTHQYSSGCYDQLTYQKDLEDQFTTVVERSCLHKNKPPTKEQILYVFSVKLNKKQERQVSSIKIRREKSSESQRLSQIP